MMNLDHRQATPSQRAKLDEERRKARHNRKMQQATPGPGNYDIKLPLSKGLEYAGSTAFRHNRKNTSMAFNGGVDAGIYDPYETSSLSARSARTMNKTASQGAASFFHRAKRVGVRAFKESKAQGPGPESYDPQEPDGPESSIGGSSFVSKTKRGAYMGRQITPGAGEYDISRSPMDRTVVGGQSAFRGSQDRFRNLWGSAAAIEEAAHRGPGTYAQEHYTMDSARKETSKTMSYVFSASSVRECKRDWALPAEIEC
jgi:hypothetical protein